MAFETATATSIGDVFTRLRVFAVANGWTADEFSADRLFLSRVGTDDTIAGAYWWDSGAPDSVGIYHHLAYGGPAVNPGQSAHVDSGNGFTQASGTPSDAQFASSRNVNLNELSMRYYFIANGDNLYVSVERFPTGVNQWTHFGLGSLEKSDDWTGGAFAYGWKFTSTGTGQSAILPENSQVLDGVLSGAGMEFFAATLHVEGLEEQPVNGKFGVVWGSNAAPGSDRQATPEVREQIVGGFRGGPVAKAFAQYASDSEKGLLPLTPIHIFHRSTTSNHLYHLGTMKDVRAVNIKNFSGAGDTITFGGDDWLLLPSYRKNNSGSRNQGLAYRLVP